MSEKLKGPERVENMVNVLRQWQGIERQSMNDTAAIMEDSKNPLIRMVMEIIRHDSLMHHRVQQFLIDGVTEKDITLSREEVAEIWDRIEAHDKVEQKTIEMAKSLRDESWSPIHRMLLDYLLTDESKHDSFLSQLGDVKSGMTRASGG